jgi:cytochrome o ubiquinol oxidase subunit 2
MHFTVTAVSADDYAKWIATARTTGSTLDQAAFAELVRPSTDTPPAIFSAVEPGLFDRVAGGMGLPDQAKLP